MEESASRGRYDYNRRNVYICALCANTLIVFSGIVMGWSSPAVPKLKEEGHNYTENQNLLLSSIPNLAPGPLLTMIGLDTIGRKATLLVIWILAILSFIMMAISQDIYVLLVARFISGLGLGATFLAVSVYFSEIADVNIRNAMNISTTVFVNLGFLIVYATGPYLPFAASNGIFIGVVSIFILMYFFMPDSPYYHVEKGRIDEARKVMYSLRKNAKPENIEDELLEIQTGIKEEKKHKTGLKKIFTSKVVYKQFAIAFYLLYLQQGSCGNAYASYTGDIYHHARLSFDASYVPIGVVFISMVMLIPCPYIAKGFGNRQLTLFGGFGSGFLLMINGIYFSLLNANYNVSFIKYLPITVDLCLSMCIYVGLSGNIWGAVAELFAPSVKGVATAISALVYAFFGFVVVSIFGYLRTYYGYGVAFLVFGIMQIIVSFGIFFVPFTDKMTLTEIQNYFESLENQEKKNKEICSK